MIKVSGLFKSYDGGNSFAVSDVNFEIESGQIFSLIGTSGCGKTSTLKMINRIVEPTKGYILIDGQGAMDVDPVLWRRRIGYVVQKAGLFPHLTVKENISLLSKVLGKHQAFIDSRVQELLNLVSMDYDRYADRYPSELSGGQQQRIGIARALMEDPPVLLMDEPFGALDPLTRNSIHDELLAINEKLGKTVLMVTHDIGEAFKLSDRVIVMDEGRVLQIGTPKEIRDNPKSDFISEFVE